MTAPARFCAELRAHNLHALAVAALSLIGAVLIWVGAYFLFVFLLLGAKTSVEGDWGPEIPRWIPLTAGILAGILFLWGICDHIRRRFAGPTDRQIIGWHLFGEFLLLPVRLTLAVAGNLSAVRWLNAAERDLAWEILTEIKRSGKMRVGALSAFERDPGKLHRLLTALQLAGYIDLQRGENDWFYTVRSTRAEEIGRLLPEK